LKILIYFMVLVLLSACGGSSTNDGDVVVDHSGTWTTEFAQRGSFALQRNYDINQQGSQVLLGACLSSPVTLTNNGSSFSGDSVVDGPYWLIGTPVSYDLSSQAESTSTLDILADGRVSNLQLSKLPTLSSSLGWVRIDKTSSSVTSTIIESTVGCGETYFGGNVTIDTGSGVISYTDDYIIALGDKLNKSWNLILRFGPNGVVTEGVYDSDNDLASIDYAEINGTVSLKTANMGSACGYAEITVDQATPTRITGSFVADVNCQDTYSGVFDLPLY